MFDFLTDTDGELSTGRRLWLLFRPALVYILSFAFAFFVLYTGYSFIMHKFVLPVDENDKTPIIIEIKSGSSSSGIASLLYGESENNQLIRSKAAFKIYVDYTGKSAKLKAGTYSFNKSMSYPDIVDMLVKGDGSAQKSVKFTLPEGLDAEGMALLLVSHGAQKSVNDYLELAKTAKGIKFELPNSASLRRYKLEGYLFPDTYEVFANTDANTIINKQLTRFNDIFTGDCIERANELGMTVDDVVILASIIEREAKTADFAKVSAVFHNRIREDMPLESCATVQYALGVRNYVLTAEQLSAESKYNTYKYGGLPAGPLCTPGKNAIMAALNPDEQYLKDGYLFFCLKEPESGELAFAKTKKEHDANVSQYRDLWLAYDAARS